MVMNYTDRMAEIEKRLQELSLERDKLTDELHPLIIEQIRPKLETLEGIHEVKYFMTNFGEYCGIVKFDIYSMLRAKEKELKREPASN
jgi:hypothetical protein